MKEIIPKKEIKKILVIKLRGIGDVVCSTMVIDNLRYDFPNAQIDYLVEKPSSYGLIGLKQLNKVWIFNRKKLSKRIMLALSVRREKYDLVFDFFGNPSSAQLTFISGAKYRVGFPLRRLPRLRIFHIHPVFQRRKRAFRRSGRLIRIN